MKIAYVHVLPLEYYPPARNTLTHLAHHRGWTVRAWTTANRRGLRPWSDPHVEITRRWDADPSSSLPARMLGYTSWHTRVAAELAMWKPQAIISVEPHSTLATWTYYNVFRGKADLYIHHHEYYAPEDYSAEGMRLLRATRGLEQRDLFRRARWISQTNEERLRLLREWNPEITDASARVLPNYPPEAWTLRASRSQHDRSDTLRMIYVGSASLADTYIREIAQWAAKHAASVSLHVTGDNVAGETWSSLQSLGANNITLGPKGCDYDSLPQLLTKFDVGLVLYKGNTLNFVHNVPNKAIEYLAAGLEVWYPREMQGMRDFHTTHSQLPLREVDFSSLPDAPPHLLHQSGAMTLFPFTAETALAPLVEALEQQDSNR